jgi:superfamily II DNA/RNA helicase
MHGDKSQSQRERALANFQAGHVDTLVATDVAARGIDVARISHVINFDPPEDRDAYVHRVGRTGRAGRPGVGITLVGAEQRREMSALARGLGIEHGLDAGLPAVRHGGPATAQRPARHGGGSGSSARRGVTRSYGHRRGGR